MLDTATVATALDHRFQVPQPGSEMTAPPEPTDDLQRLARDLAEAVEHQAATSDVIEVMGRSRFELEPVFDTVVQHAVRLCGADSGQVWQLEGDLYRLTCCSSWSARASSTRRRGSP
jgi:hypothetical protein